MLLHRKRKLCPLMEEFYHSCYCSNMTSQTVMDAIYYCGEHFLECEIYKKLKVKKEKSFIKYKPSKKIKT